MKSVCGVNRNARAANQFTKDGNFEHMNKMEAFISGSVREEASIGKRGGRSQLWNCKNRGYLQRYGLWTESARTWYHKILIMVYWAWPRVFWLQKPVARAVLTAKPSAPWLKPKANHSNFFLSRDFRHTFK